jgi:hypothetical protein
MIGRIALAVATLAAGACATAEQPIPVRGETSGRTCDDSGIQDFVGRQRSPELEAEMLRASGAVIVRWVPQGAAVTMEFRADRLTAWLDASNRIERIGCS